MTWFSKKTFVVPIDLSPHSIRALDEALSMGDTTSVIHVVHVLHESPAIAPEFSPVFDLTAEMENTKRIIHDRLKDEKYRAVNVHVSYGDPGIEIAKFAEEVKADLIVISSHGRRGWQRLLIGSVAERVVRLAHCPVFVLKS
jgi:nucleotide-binding universal stress UspA family protein